MPFFPDFLVKDLAAWMIALTVLAVLAALFPWELGEAADPLEPAPKGIHPEWYFMSSFQVLKLFGNWFPGRVGEVLGMAVFGLGLALWFLIPLYDTRRESGWRARRATYLGLAALAALVIATIWGYLGLR
jgi:cytochrome b6